MRSSTSMCCCPCSTTQSTTGSAKTRSRSCCGPVTAGWPSHPERELITRRYLRHRETYVRSALARLAEADDLEPERARRRGGRCAGHRGAPNAGAAGRAAPRRRASRCCAEMGAHRVVDMGCGEGALLRELLASTPRSPRWSGSTSPRGALGAAARGCGWTACRTGQRERFKLRPVVADVRRPRLAGYDAVVLMEVVEHVDPSRLPALERSVFGCARPDAVIVTTPNAEYNVRFETLPAGRMRHRGPPVRVDPRRVPAMGRGVAARHGYTVGYRPIGDDDPEVGPPTQRARSFPQVRPMSTPRFPSCRWSARRRVRIGQVDVRAQALRARRGALQRLLPRSRRRRRERPVGDDGRVRRAALHRRASDWPPGGSPWSTPPTCSRTAAQAVSIAREHDVLPVAIVLDMPE